MNRLRSAVQRVRESLFFLPVTIMVLCGALALAALQIDSTLTDQLMDIPFLLSATLSGGRSIVTTVAGATITVAAIVFSITALSSQIAANQYSPRAVRGFFEDTFQQLTIGLIVGTFSYSLVVLGGLGSSLVGASEPTPSVSITLAVFLGLASAIGIVAYLDHSLRRFQVDSVVRRIAGETLKAVKKHHVDNDATQLDLDSPTPSGESEILEASRSGWVQRIDASLLSNEMPPDSTAKVEVRLGEAVSQGDRLARLWCNPDDLPAARKVVVKNVVLGRDRSLADDPSFGLRQLVDIALKALSPGINDPTTAVDVVHHLKIAVREILHSDPPQRVHHGKKGQKVYLAEAHSRSDFVHGAFSQIRLAARDQLSVLKALLEVLADLSDGLSGTELTGRLGAVHEEYNLTIDAIVNSGVPDADIRRVLGDRKKYADEKTA